jgi:hypothetical protein
MAEGGPLRALQQWHALLLAERARRAARAELEAGQDERERKQFFDTLQQMAQRFAATAHLHPLQIDDMSIAEQLACHLLPEELRPAGLGTEDQIWAEYRSRCDRA